MYDGEESTPKYQSFIDNLVSVYSLMEFLMLIQRNNY